MRVRVLYEFQNGRAETSKPSIVFKWHEDGMDEDSDLISCDWNAARGIHSRLPQKGTLEGIRFKTRPFASEMRRASSVDGGGGGRGPSRTASPHAHFRRNVWPHRESSPAPSYPKASKARAWTTCGPVSGSSPATLPTTSSPPMQKKTQGESRAKEKKRKERMTF